MLLHFYIFNGQVEIKAKDPMKSWLQSEKQSPNPSLICSKYLQNCSQHQPHPMTQPFDLHTTFKT